MDSDSAEQPCRVSARGRAAQVHKTRHAQRARARRNDSGARERIADRDDARWPNRGRVSKIGNGRSRGPFLAGTMPGGTADSLYPAEPMKIDLNCDLGEGEPLELTEALMRHITSANVGSHNAKECVALAKRY